MTAGQHFNALPPYTDEIAKYVNKLDYDDLPDAVIQQAKLLTLDTLGVILAASAPKYPAGRIMVELVKKLGGREESTVIGSGFKTSCVNAALANGTMSDSIELDDSHPKSAAHVAAIIIPSALAVGEREGIDGKTFITSVVVGYDVDIRAVLALNPSALYDRGFHPSAVGGSFGSTATAGKILKLGTNALVKAFGIAGSEASGLMAWERDPTQMPKAFQMGLASKCGVLAALLAQSGFSGPTQIFEGRYGAVAAFSDKYQLTELADELGTRFEIMLTGLKQYACCKFLHASLDSYLGLIRENNLKPEDMKSVTIRIPTSGAPIIDGNELISHNSQYILSVAAYDGNVTVDHIYEDKRKDPKIADFSKRVRVVGDEELAKVFPGFFSEPAVVEVETRDGRELTKRTDCPKGDPGNPMAKADVERKFLSLATPIIGPEKVQETIEIVNRLEKMSNIGVVCDLIRK